MTIQQDMSEEGKKQLYDEIKLILMAKEDITRAHYLTKEIVDMLNKKYDWMQKPTNKQGLEV